MAIATKEKRESKSIASQSMEAAMVECEILAIVEHLGSATFGEIVEALPHRTEAQIRGAVKRQSSYCLRTVKIGKMRKWALI